MKIDVYSDMVCPWCRIGKKNLETALAAWARQTGETPEPVYHAFLLDPSVPPEGLPFRETMTGKFGNARQVDDMLARVTEAGAAVGLTFRFDRISRMPNTLLAHRITALLPRERQGDWIDAVMTDYFEHGRDIGDADVLLDIAAGLGFDSADLRARLDAGEGTRQVEDDLAAAQAMGINGVPFFVLNRRYALSGAWPADRFLEAFRQVADRERESGRNRRPTGG